MDLGNDLYDGRLSYAESDILGEAGKDVLRGGVINDSPYGANNDDHRSGDAGDDGCKAPAALLRSPPG